MRGARDRSSVERAGEEEVLAEDDSSDSRLSLLPSPALPVVTVTVVAVLVGLMSREGEAIPADRWRSGYYAR